MEESAAAKPVLRGPRVTLRPPRERDRADRLACGRSPELVRMYGADPENLGPLTADEADRWYGLVARSPLHWMIEAEGRCVGDARLHSLDPSNRRARYAVGIFDPSAWDRGYGTETTRLILAHAFEALDLHRVDLRVLEHNARAIRCYEKCGFVRDGVEREGTFIGGEWRSDVLMSILEHEYREVSRGWASER